MEEIADLITQIDQTDVFGRKRCLAPNGYEVLDKCRTQLWTVRTELNSGKPNEPNNDYTDTPQNHWILVSSSD